MTFTGGLHRTYPVVLAPRVWEWQTPKVRLWEFHNGALIFMIMHINELFGSFRIYVRQSPYSDAYRIQQVSGEVVTCHAHFFLDLAYFPTSKIGIVDQLRGGIGVPLEHPQGSYWRNGVGGGSTVPWSTLVNFGPLSKKVAPRQIYTSPVVKGYR